MVFEDKATSDQRTKFLFLSKLWTMANTQFRKDKFVGRFSDLVGD